MEEHDLKGELEATLHARQEVGMELEPQLVEQFLAKLDAEIDRRIDARVASKRPRPSGGMPLAVPLGSLGIGIPLIGAAGGVADLAGVIAACIAIVLVNLIYYLSNR